MVLQKSHPGPGARQYHRADELVPEREGLITVCLTGGRLPELYSKGTACQGKLWGPHGALGKIVRHKTTSLCWLTYLRRRA